MTGLIELIKSSPKVPSDRPETSLLSCYRILIVFLFDRIFYCLPDVFGQA